eukprot:TRINITY_DN4041_c0_g2_i3.p1 TRINITY_DN4041_c0_g2~~TRINITY_DN4041_c0_g2_i3.p1  ORF type:complete len:230 (-),score=36.62 TRINITY_DN4041_c0_g2_i3:241-909(-)
MGKMDEDERDSVAESTVPDDTALSRRLGLRWRYRCLYESQSSELSRAQENLALALFPFQQNKLREEMVWRQQLSSFLEPYVALTQEEQELEKQGKLDALQIEPEVTSDKLMIGVASSDLPTDLVLFYLALLAATGVETWEAALRLDAASPCFENVPSVLVKRLLSVIERLQHDDMQALAREDVLRRIYGIGQWAWSFLPTSVAGLFYAESMRSTDDAADKKD